MSYRAPSSVLCPKASVLGAEFSPLSEVVTHCMTTGCSKDAIPQAVWDGEGLKGYAHPAWSREPWGTFTHGEAAAYEG